METVVKIESDMFMLKMFESVESGRVSLSADDNIARLRYNVRLSASLEVWGSEWQRGIPLLLTGVPAPTVYAYTSIEDDKLTLMGGLWLVKLYSLYSGETIDGLVWPSGLVEPQKAADWRSLRYDTLEPELLIHFQDLRLRLCQFVSPKGALPLVLSRAADPTLTKSVDPRVLSFVIS
ncbi:hypothetical protein FACS1894184_05200 [Clostridia bacterium]|nr:hypothetical protein FACS1894184_05200 [Clostridia bacterium]